MTRFVKLAALIALVGCAQEQPAADSAAAEDSIREAVEARNAQAALDSARADSQRVADSIAAARGTKTGTATGQPSSTRTGTKGANRESPNIGRDSVIRRPRTMPAMDTTRPPA